MIKKEIKIKGLNFWIFSALASNKAKKLYFFFRKLLIFWIIVIVVFYKNKMTIATLDGQKSLILLL